MTEKTEKTEPLTMTMIRELRDEAGCVGDHDLVGLCEDALDVIEHGDHPEWNHEQHLENLQAIADIISEARGQDDECEFVRVVVAQSTLFSSFFDL